MPDMRPFEMRSFDEEVEIAEALRKAREEIKTAGGECDRIRAQARAEGLELGRKDAQTAATKAERERVEKETAGLAGILQAAAAGIESRRQELMAAAERDLLALAIAIAEKIVKVEVAGGGRIAAENLRRAVELTARRQELRVLLHPDDLALVEAFLPDLRRQFPDVQKIDLEANAAVGRGGAIVQTREGSVDASVATQLAEIERGLLG